MIKETYAMAKFELEADSIESMADTLRKIAAQIEKGYMSGMDSNDDGEYYNWLMGTCEEELEGEEYDNAKEELVEYIKYLISDCEPADEDGNGGPWEVIGDHLFGYVTPSIAANHQSADVSYKDLCEYLDSEEIMEECICKALEAYDEALAASN